MAEQHTTESGFKTNLLPNWLQWSTNTVQMCITGIMSIALSSPWHQTSDSILNSAFVAIMTSSKCHRRTVWWYRSKQSTCHRLKNVPVILTVSTKLEPCTVFRHVVGVWSCREWGLPWSCDTLDNRFPDFSMFAHITFLTSIRCWGRHLQMHHNVIICYLCLHLQ